MIYNPKESKYEANYAYKTVGKLVSKLGKGKNLSIVSPKGFGTSNILRFLCFSPLIKEKYPTTDGIKFVYTGLLSMFGDSLESLASAVVKAILDKTAADGLLTPDEYKEELEHLMIANSVHAYIYILDLIMEKIRDQHLYIVLDDFGKLLRAENREVFNLLRYIGDRYSLNINYIMAISNLDYYLALPDTDLGAYGSIVTQQLFFLPVIDKEEIPTILNRYQENRHLYTEKEIKEITAETGGYISYLHYLEVNGLKNLATHTTKLDSYSKDLIDSLTEEQKRALIIITQKKEIPHELNLATDTLLAYGLLCRKGQTLKICSSILANYITTHGIEIASENTLLSEFEMSLTKYEAAAFKVLKSAPDSIVTRTTLINEIWGPRGESIYSEWTLDQLIMRLRRKLDYSKLPIKIATRRGRGYVLSSTAEFH
jgi:DNA-binding winged helix-turn-helix (wHTH) protein